jgi:single-strand DNA-binding protein
MASYNKVLLMGNLTRDPETRFTQGGMPIVSFGLAVNERFQGSDGQWQDRATFVDVTIFGKRGEAFAKFHKKGQQAFVEGKLRLDTWEDKNGGGKRSKLFVVGDSWEFVGGGGGPGREGGGRGVEGREQGGSAPSGDSWGGAAPADSGSWGGAAPAEFSDTPF